MAHNAYTPLHSGAVWTPPSALDIDDTTRTSRLPPSPPPYAAVHSLNHISKKYFSPIFFVLSPSPQDAPAVMRNQSFPAIAKTLGIMTRVGTKFAMIGGVFVGVSVRPSPTPSR